jgi:hypothetical protein
MRRSLKRKGMTSARFGALRALATNQHASKESQIDRGEAKRVTVNSQVWSLSQKNGGGYFGLSRVQDRYKLSVPEVLLRPLRLPTVPQNQ